VFHRSIVDDKSPPMHSAKNDAADTHFFGFWANHRLCENYIGVINYITITCHIISE
jgi:hypothetical protein